MSINRCLKSSGSAGAVQIDEIVALGFVIIIFSSSMAFGMEMIALWDSSNQIHELEDIAYNILRRVRDDPSLVVGDQAGMFDLRKLVELDNRSFVDLARIPENCGWSMTVIDVDHGSRIEPIHLRQNPGTIEDPRVNEMMVIDAPVNIHLNDLEIHPGMMTLCLWR
jgi:hypothetical protein